MINLKSVILIIVIITLNVLQCKSQLQKFILPNDSYIPCSYANFEAIETDGIPGIAQNLSYCPPSTLCVNWQYPSRVPNSLVAASEIVFSAITSPGCCSEEAPVPCFTSSGIASISGCCPLGKYCCPDPTDTNRILGCADSVYQCCGTTICPSGYSCCFTDDKRAHYCCPGPNSAYPILNETATELNNSTIPLYQFVPNSYPLNASVLFDTREYNECAKVNSNATERIPFFVNGTSGEAFPCGTNGTWCRGESYIEEGWNSTLGVADKCFDRSGNLIDQQNETEILDNGNFCCPNNTEPCLSGGLSFGGFEQFVIPQHTSTMSQPGTFLGCADIYDGESCCSTQICSKGNKCCRFEIPDTWDSSPIQNVNQIQQYIQAAENDTVTNTTTLTDITDSHANICCPIGTFCCAKIIPIPQLSTDVDYFNSDLSRFSNVHIFTYCGRNSNCTSNSMLSEMFQIAPSLSKSGFLPDYIQDIGWLDDPLKYFSSQVQLASEPASTINPNCKVFSGTHYTKYDYCGIKQSQNDQCHLGF